MGSDVSVQEAVSEPTESDNRHSSARAGADQECCAPVMSAATDDTCAEHSAAAAASSAGSPHEEQTLETAAASASPAAGVADTDGQHSAASSSGAQQQEHAVSNAHAVEAPAVDNSAASSAGSSAGAAGDEVALSTAADAGDNSCQSSVFSSDETGAQDDACQTVYEVNIKCIDGTVTKMQIPSNLRGFSLKQRILNQLHVPIERQRLIFRGRVVQDEDVLGQHITQSGQTIHLVQRPASVLNGSAQSSNSQGEDGQPAGPPPQTTATDSVGNPPPIMTFPGQSELSQILGSMLGAVNARGDGGPVIHTVPLVRGPSQPNAPGAVPGMVASPQGVDGATSPANGLFNFFTPSGTSPQAGTAAGNGFPSWRRGWPSRDCMMLSLLLGCLALVMPMLAWCIVQIEATFVVSSPPWHIWAFGFHLLGLVLGLPSLCLALRSRSPLRGFRALIAPGTTVQHDQTGLTQFLAAMAVQPLQSPQIVFQQGLNLGTANITATVQEEGFDMPDPGINMGLGPDLPSANVGVATHPGPQAASPAATADGRPQSLPWQELQGFGDQLDRLLRRPSRPGRLTAGGMPPLVFGAAPGAELQAFLAALHAATSQLGVGISDIQTSLAAGAEPDADTIRQLSLSFAAAARVLNNASTAVQGEILGSVNEPAMASQQEATPISTEVD